MCATKGSVWESKLVLGGLFIWALAVLMGLISFHGHQNKVASQYKQAFIYSYLEGR